MGIEAAHDLAVGLEEVEDVLLADLELRRLDEDLREESLVLETLRRQTLEGSFPAVSKPNFASKHALESSRRDLQNTLLCTVL